MDVCHHVCRRVKKDSEAASHVPCDGWRHIMEGDMCASLGPNWGSLGRAHNRKVHQHRGMQALLLCREVSGTQTLFAK